MQSTAVHGMSEIVLDVGVVALAHTNPETPGQENALDHVRRAIRGERETVVPYSSVLGAHHVLRDVYRMPRAEASHRLSGFVGAERPQWYGGITERDSMEALSIAGEHNIDAWDGYYAHVARKTGAGTVLTLDDDFERVDGFSTEVILSPTEFAELSEYIDEISR
jgi:predicted nucleic acid-binding protein